MSESEDLIILKAECAKIRETAFYAMRDALRMSPELLRCSGYKTNEAAVIGHFKYAEAKIEKLTKEFLKKYPDER